MRVMHTMSPIEVVWTLVALAGSYYSAYNLHDARIDWRIVQERRINGARRIVARSNMRREWVRLWCLLACLVIGVVALLSPPSEPSQQPLRAALAAVALIALEVLLTYNTWEDRRARLVLRDVLLEDPRPFAEAPQKEASP